MAAMAVDHDAAQAHRAHLSERDLARPAIGVGSANLRKMPSRLLARSTG